MSLPHTPAHSPATASTTRRARRSPWPFACGIAALVATASSASAFVVGPASSCASPLRRGPAALGLGRMPVASAAAGSGGDDAAFLAAVKTKVTDRVAYKRRQLAARELEKGERLREEDEPQRGE